MDQELNELLDDFLDTLARVMGRDEAKRLIGRAMARGIREQIAKDKQSDGIRTPWIASS